MKKIIEKIKTKKDHEEALGHIEVLMNKSPNLQSEETDTLEVLVTLVKEYESKKFPTKLPDPIAAIKFRMDQEDLTQKDLIPYIGSRSRVSEILSGKRSLTLPMIRRLSDGLDIPLNSLIGTFSRSPRKSTAKNKNYKKQGRKVRVAA